MARIPNWGEKVCSTSIVSGTRRSVLVVRSIQWNLDLESWTLDIRLDTVGPAGRGDGRYDGGGGRSVSGGIASWTH
jgi:hypothetical protein